MISLASARRSTRRPPAALASAASRALCRSCQLALVLMLSAAAAPLSAAAETDNCASAANPIVCENALPGDPPANWQIEGTGDPTIQGFATAISVNVGETEYFKIATDARSYRIEILRLGYYGGDGARLITTLRPSASLPQSQPECLKYSSTGLIDCGNWAVSASWRVPEGAVSGVYIALLTREDTGGQSQIPFVVRNDASHASILLQTSDATWEAYNDWGGNSLYSCAVDCPPGDPEGYKAAYAVSYNRPWEGSFAIDGGRSYLWYAEYQLIYWLEENGYNVSYTTSAEVGRQPALLKNHSIFISSGHDEYWSASQRKAVEEALAAGVSLAFFSGNEMFWKTRWAPSTEGANVPDRTLITYKETHFNAPVDPEDPPTWTGSWRDPRFSPPADGGKPESALTGQYFLVNSGTADLTVPYRYSKLRLWRNTAVAALVPGQSLMLSPGTGTLGYEWDETVENGFRPPGELELSETTVSGLQTFVDYGSNVTEPSTATHHLTLYRAPSGALVFGAGTVQWSWGLANVNAWSSLTTDPSGNPPDPNMEQFTVNLLAEMGAQPGSLIAGLLPGTKAAPGAPPSATITQPSEGASFEDGTRQTIAGTAQAHAGGAVAAVEVSTDGGASWHAATITGADEESVSWTYPWVAHGAPTSTIEARAVDEEGEIGSPSAPVNATVRCPCSIWGIGEKPANVDSGDGSSVELGVKFTADEYGWIDGVRFYRSAANSGAHIVGLWSEAGALLASATQTAEGEAGWEQVDFPSPVQIEAHRTYIAGYFAPHGHYSADPYYFYSPPATGSATLGSPPLQAVQATSQSSNGLYLYTSSPAEPTESYNATNYWVDPLFTPAALPGVPTAIAAAPQAGAAIVSWSPPAEGGPVTEYIVTPYAGTSALAPTIVRGTPPEATAVVSGLTPGQSYTFAVQAANPNGKGPLSARSAAITPPAYAAPSAVRAVLARPAGHSALVSWSAPSLDGGEPITSYTITPFIGSAAQSPITVGQQARSATISGLANGTTYTFRVSATNAIGTGEPSAATNAVTPEDTLLEFATPALPDAGDPSAVELGVKIHPKVSGAITGIRFYKSAANSGPHTGSLWSASGTLLASASFEAESESGWQEATFAEPVPVQAGETYVAGYFAPHGHYAASSEALAAAPIENGPLLAPATSTTPDGVYAYASSPTFPTSSYNATSYWVDVMFAPTPPSGPPAAPSEVFAAVASGVARVSWGPPASEGGGPITSYTITPFIGSAAQSPITVGQQARSATISGLANGTTYTFRVSATNAIGTGEPSAASNEVTPEDTIFGFAQPAIAAVDDNGPLEVGVKFRSSLSGTITGVRFYKSAANTGPHVASLWTLGGQLLASRQFGAESDEGWQQVTFESPVPIRAGETYIAGYFAPRGHYAATTGAFAGTASLAPPLEALANELSLNGIYAYGSGPLLPTESYNATNYWVDVLFAPGASSAPAPPTAVFADAAGHSALVSWSAPSLDGGEPITSYTITPFIGSAAQSPITVGQQARSATISGLANGTTYTFRVSATNAIGTGEPSAATNAVTPEDTLLEFATPALPDAGDPSAVELGVKIHPKVSGAITGIRFYKSAANSGPHTGSLWSASGTLLASASFEAESESGWQEATFAEPVPVQAGETYVAGYFAPHGHYAASSEALAAAPIENGPLLAPATSTTPDGVYAYASSPTFPTSSYNATSYWVDVMFAPTP